MADSIPPIWIPAGTPIASWNSGIANEGLATISFPSTFVFPLFGDTYTSVTVSSNGSLYFGGAPGDSQPLATVAELLQGLPRIAPAWYNIEAINGNGSILESILPGQVVFTWEDVASFVPLPLPGQSVPGPVPVQNLAAFQVILDGGGSASPGTVIFAYEALNSLNPATTGVDNSLVGSPQAVIGITDGQGVFPDPGSTDLSSIATPPGFSLTTASNTIYQLIYNNPPTNPPDNSNLAGLDLIFTPAATGGWTVTSEYNSDPAPEPATFAEMALSAFVLVGWWRLNSLMIRRCRQ